MIIQLFAATGINMAPTRRLPCNCIGVRQPGIAASAFLTSSFPVRPSASGPWPAPGPTGTESNPEGLYVVAQKRATGPCPVENGLLIEECLKTHSVRRTRENL